MAKTGYGINLPITPQTDPRNYPDYKYEAYPRMMHEVCTKEYVEFWRQKNGFIDDRSGKVSYLCVSPKLGSQQPLRADETDVELGYAKVIGQPVIVHNAHEEREVLERRGIIDKQAKAKPVDVEIGGDAKELAELRAENARLRAAPNRQSTGDAPRQKRKYTRHKDSENVRVKELPTEA